MKRIFTAGLLLMMAAGLFGAGKDEAKGAAKSAVKAAAKDTAADFSLPASGGKEFRLYENLDKGYVVINFWASWCSTCEEEIPELAALMKSPGADKVVFAGVNVGDKPAKAEKFVKKYKYPYLAVFDRSKAVAKSYGVLGLPATLIISKDRKIVFRGSRPPKTFDFTK